MCGIIGYIGKRKVADVLLTGLKNLEYRGYDSCGISFFSNDEIKSIKSAGKIQGLEEKIKNTEIEMGHLGIAHTRWATHGSASEMNAHPHTVSNITLVHNGIIENAELLKGELLEKGYFFQTETDTEVVAALIDSYYQGDLVSAIFKAENRMKGSYALGIIVKGESDKIYAVRKDSPLVIGYGNEEYFIASDISAILEFTKQYVLLEEGEVAILESSGVKVIDSNYQEVVKKVLLADIDAERQSKNSYEHYMLKEIMEEPILLENLIKMFVDSEKMVISNLPDVSKYEEIHIVACGSALYAGEVGKYLLEEKSRIPVFVSAASEYRYRSPIYSHKTLVILISQSGETADTIAALRMAKDRGIPTLAIVNTESSTIAREVDDVIFIKAGVEVAVATTKAYILQVAILSLLSLKAAIAKGIIRDSEMSFLFDEFISLPEKIQEVLHRNYQNIAKEIYNSSTVFFIGRGIDYTMCLEGSLKLKEVSYIHSEAYQAGELKHGSISLIERGTPVIALITSEELKDKSVSNLIEAKSRGAKCIVVVTEKTEIEEVLKIVVEGLSSFTQTLLVVPILQLLAYEVAKLRGCEIDQPRNLAKSVTVE